MKITVVSYRGGSGKSLFAINLATSLPNTLLIEADFLAPALTYVSPTTSKYWNDYLLGNCDSKDIINSVGNIDLVYTNPDIKDLFKHIQNRKMWGDRFSDRISKFLVEQEKKHEFIIIDNQGGRFLSSVTHAFFADFLICVLRPDQSDVIATASYLKNLRKDFYLVWNQVLSHSQMTEVISKWTEECFTRQINYKGTLGVIPFDEGTAFQRWVQRKLFIKDTKFAYAVEEIAKKLTKLNKE
ncbi:MAG: MinD/ParA family protein, partial [Candidatus Hermodarchaeota archaeon]